MFEEYQFTEVKGIKTFEKLSFRNFGRQPKILKNEACFMFLLNGSFQIRTPLKSVVFSKNEGLLSNCGDYIYEDIDPKEEAELIEVIGVYFPPKLIKDIFQEISVKWNEGKYVAYRMSVDTLLENYKNTLLHYFQHPILFDEEMQMLKVKELLLILSKTENAPTVHHLISSLYTPQEYDFRKIIESNMYASLSIPELAILCGMSTASFKRKFGELYDTSPAEYLKTRKLEKAAHLLRTGTQRVTDILYDCGFESISTFNRAFKQHYKLSPSAYRLSQNGQ